MLPSVDGALPVSQSAHALSLNSAWPAGHFLQLDALASEICPGAHGSHDFFSLENSPALHSVQVASPSAAADPSAHASQSVLPSFGTLPALHFLHVRLPGVSLYSPAPHGSHVVLSLGIVPAWHWVHVRAPVAATEPEPQAVQPPLPSGTEPAAHPEQVPDPAAELVPAGHASHAVCGALEICPASQAVHSAAPGSGAI